PVRMTPRTAASPSMWSTASPSSAITLALSALSLSGRLMVIRAMPSWTSYSRDVKDMGVIRAALPAARRQVLVQVPLEQAEQVGRGPRPLANAMGPVGIGHHRERLVGGDQRVH